MKHLIKLLTLLCASTLAWGQTAGTVSLTATPTSGNGVTAVSITWSSTPPASSCAITGGGITNPTATPAGAATDSIVKTTTYGIACNWTRTSNVLHWFATTLNTDGSPLVDLAGYTIWWGLAGNPSSSPVRLNNPGLLTYTLTPPAPGTYVFTIQACNTAGLCSPPSASVTGPPIGTSVASATATTTVTPIPAAPTGLSVQ